MLGFSVVRDAIGGLNVLNTYRPLQLLGARGVPQGLQPGATGGDGLFVPCISRSVQHNPSRRRWLRCCSRQSSWRHSSASYRLQYG
jgi:hypothetical protein